MQQSNVGVSKVITGARAIFATDAGGTEASVGYAGGCDGSEEVMYEPIDALNNMFVQEHAPTGYRCNLNSAVFRMPDSTLKTMGIFPKTKDPINDMVKFMSFSAYITDEVTGNIVFKMSGTKPTTANFSVNARGVMQHNVSFVGIKMIDIAELS